MTGGPFLQVGARVAATRAEGPGARYALWVRGCSLRCPGCCNPQFFASGGPEGLAVTDLLREVWTVRHEIEGVTLLGGEPFEQAAGLAVFARGARELGLSVMAFSGYTLEELRRSADPGVAELLGVADVLVDGRYDAARPEGVRMWAGSTNQRFHYLTDRYGPEIERPLPGRALRTLEVQIGTEGRWSANGWPDL